MNASGGFRAISGTLAGAVSGAGQSPTGGLASALFSRIGALFEQEARERRLFLWLPVFFGLGILAYFAADQEPPLWPAASLALVLAAGGLRAHRLGRAWPARVCAAGAFLFAGFACATFRTATVEAPVLERPMTAKVTAFVEAIDPRIGGARLFLRVGSIEGLGAAQTPVRMRVTMRGSPNFAAGASIAATMRLSPPPRASEPSGYDFSRDAYFQRMGAVGSVLSRVQLAPAVPAPLATQLVAWVDRGRNALTLRIAGVIGGSSGAVAASLVTGKRGLIPEEINESLRGAGIYHVVSISGLHMVLAAGLLMWTMRAVLALIPGIALRRPIKKWAAGFAMAGAVGYCVFSGAEVATERAMVMMLVLLGAVLFDRPALSMRNLAIAALIVLVREPSTLLGPSFQMSFAAVAGMVALFEKGPRDRDFAREAPPGAFERARKALFAVLATTLVASLATDPYATFHFHRLSAYGLIGNALALPVVEFIVMPAAAIGVVASLFGLDAPVWWMMGQGVSVMVWVAEWVAQLPGAIRMTPAFGVGALLAMTMGIIWITLWRSALRWFGIVFALAGLALAFNTPRPDLFIDANGSTLAWRGEQGTLHALNERANPFALSQWLAGDADMRNPRATGAKGLGLLGPGRCDETGCVAILPDGRSLALVLDMRALAEDCARADIVVTKLFVRNLCKQPALVLDGDHFERHGATQVYMTPNGRFSLRSVRAPDLDRPWTKAPKPPAAAEVLTPQPVRGAGEPEDFEIETEAPDLRFD